MAKPFETLELLTGSTIVLANEYAQYKKESEKLLGPRWQEVEDSVNKIIDEDGYASEIVSLFDDESIYEGKNKKGNQDLKLPEWLELSQLEKQFNKDFVATKILKDLTFFIPGLKEWLLAEGNAKLSWGDTSGMMPYHDANFPKDALLIDIKGVDHEPEIQMTVGELAEQVGFPEKKMDTFVKWLNIAGRFTGIRTDKRPVQDASSHFDAYTRIQVNYAIYFKAKELKAALRQLSGGVDAKNRAKVRELTKELESSVGQWR